MSSQETIVQKAKHEKALAIVDELMHSATVISETAKGFPKRRKYWISKVWFYFSDRKKSRLTMAKIMITIEMGRIQLMMIGATPIPKFDKGVPDHGGGQAIIE
jgi:hypothetical protein